MANRREKVTLELDDGGFSTQMAKDAAATMLLERALKSLDGTTVNIHQRLSESATQVDKLSQSSQRADKSINQLTGRLRLFADAAAILGPSVAPIGGVLTAGIAGLANQMGVAAIAGGVLIGSVQGLGDAFKAMDEARLEPTADNLAKVEQALSDLSPAAASFAEQAYGLLPLLKSIRDAGAEGLFPGLTDSLDDLERLAPVVANIFNSMGSALGDVAADSAASLASDRWADFFDFIATEAPGTFTKLAATVGDLTHGLAELWMAFTPLNNDFSNWLMDVADGFDSWASGLSQTEGFREFVAYIRETGPQVADTVGALANAIVQVVQAAAPLGGPVLAAIEAVANAIGTIADSDLGAPIMAGVGALAIYNRSLMATSALQRKIDGTMAAGGGGLFGALGQRQAGIKGSFAAAKADAESLAATWATAGARTSREQERVAKTTASLKTNLGGLAKETGRVAGPLAGMGIIASGAADGFGLTNTASLALLGTLGGPAGVAIGATAGALLDLKASGEGATAAIEGLSAAVDSGDMSVLQEQIAAAKAELDDITNTDFTSAGDIFGQIGYSFADVFGGPSADDARQKIAAAEEELRRLAAAKNDVASDKTYYNSLQAETGVLEENISAMRAKRDEALRSFSAQTNYSQSLLDSNAALEENGRAWNLNTDAGLANRRIVEQQASAWNDLNRTQGQTPAQAQKARKALIDTATDLGATRAEARRYADQLLDIPNDLKTKIALDVDTATQKARAIKAELASIDRNIDVYVNIRRPNAGGFGPQAVSTNAYGDVKNRHQPQMAKGGEWRVWAEPETQGESYIPHANDSRRPRARSILEQTAGILGARSIEWFADGGSKGDKKKPKRNLQSLDESSVDLSGFLKTQFAQAEINRDAAVQQLLAAQTASRVADANAETARKNDEAADKALEAAQQQYDSMKSQTAGLFDIDPLARPDSAWGANADPFSSLADIIQRTSDYSAGASWLAGRGLDGAALTYGLGSEDRMAQLGAMSDEDLQRFEDMFNAANEGVLQASTTAADLAYGAQVATATAAAVATQTTLDAALAQQVATANAVQTIQGQLGQFVGQLDSIAQQIGEAAANGVVNGGNKLARRGVGHD